MIEPKKINQNIEALRGFAALFVVWHHAIVWEVLDPGFRPSGVFSYAPSGHFNVLLFFILSGYVIGLTNKQALTWTTSLTYLKKRLVRLYPIFLLTLLLTLLLVPKQFPVATIAGNLFLLQGLLVPDINFPGWSLHYEMLYYLLFIPFSIFRFNWLAIIAVSLLVGGANFALYPVLDTPIITSYCYGLVFWLFGLGISRWLALAKPVKHTNQILVGCLLFMLCIDQFNLFDILLRIAFNKAGINAFFPESVWWDRRAIIAFDLTYLPYALLIILVFIGKKFWNKLLLLRALFLFSALNLLNLGRHYYAGDLDLKPYALPTAFLLASLICLLLPASWLERLASQLIRVGVRLGSLSYGIYLIHYPLVILLSRIHFLSGTWQTFVGRFAFLISLTLVAAHLLEEILQPRIKQFFFSSPPPAAIPAPSK